MSGAYYDIYVKSILRLVGTLVIKSEQAATAINDRLSVLQYPVDANDPRTWKYYLHLAGLYHVSDEVMRVTSMDTLETIDFTAANMVRHVETRAAYSYGTRYYNELVAKFPSQVSLIKGILNPVPLDTAIAAENHTIVYYDRTLVEPAETNLVDEMQEFVRALFARFDVPDYHMTTQLYTSAMYGMLFATLPRAIQNIRKRNCRTDRVHTYHLHSYLASFGGMRPYLEYMTHKQKLFFYRNIRYILRNHGKVDIFEWLTEKVLTDRGLPLAEYTLRQNYQEMPESLYPSVEMVRRSVNGLVAASGDDVRTPRDVMLMQVPLAKDNLTVLEDAHREVLLRMENSLSSEVKTKVLESNVIDRTNSDVFSLTDVLLYHWIYLAERGLYTAAIRLTNPSTGEALDLTPKDAFILWLYAYNLPRTGPLPSLPVIEAKRVRKLPRPSYEELESLIDTKWVNPGFITEAISDQVPIEEYISVAAFRQACVATHQTMVKHYTMARIQNYDTTRILLEIMTDRFYCDYSIDLGSETLYDNWLRERNLDLSLLSANDQDLFAQEIYNAATGSVEVTDTSLNAIQRAMLSIMTEYNSYSVQFIQQINVGGLVSAGKKMLKARGHTASSSSSGIRLRRIRYENRKSRIKMRVNAGRRPTTGLAAAFKTARKEFLELGFFRRLVNKTATKTMGRTARITFDWIAPAPLNLASRLSDLDIGGYPLIESRPVSELFTSTVSDSYDIGLDPRESLADIFTNQNLTALQAPSLPDE